MEEIIELTIEDSRRTWRCEFCKVKVGVYRNFREVKEAIQRVSGVEASGKTLYFNGILLEDHECIFSHEECTILDGSWIQMDVAPVVTIQVSSPLTLTQFALVMNPEDKVRFLKENIRNKTESWWKLAADAGVEAHLTLSPPMSDNHTLRYCEQLTNGFVQCQIEAVLRGGGSGGGSGGVTVANRLELVISPKRKRGNFMIKMQVEGSVLVREIRGILVIF